jgi:hypothetical protein
MDVGCCGWLLVVVANAEQQQRDLRAAVRSAGTARSAATPCNAETNAERCDGM